MDQMQPCIKKLAIAKHWANTSNHKHQAQMAGETGLKAWKKLLLLLPAGRDT